MISSNTLDNEGIFYCSIVLIVYMNLSLYGVVIKLFPTETQRSLKIISITIQPIVARSSKESTMKTEKMNSVETFK